MRKKTPIEVLLCWIWDVLLDIRHLGLCWVTFHQSTKGEADGHLDFRHLGLCWVTFPSEHLRKKRLPPVRLELTAFRLWDWRAAYCATEARCQCKKLTFTVLGAWFSMVKCIFQRLISKQSIIWKKVFTCNASAGNRTRVNCLEGSYAHHYTTDAYTLGGRFVNRENGIKVGAWCNKQNVTAVTRIRTWVTAATTQGPNH